MGPVMAKQRANEQRDPGDGYATLGLLGAVEQESHVTQRTLAARLGIALGLTNALVKRCARKGLIKIQQAPAGRYVYYLTPRGFAEKSRLTAEYLKASLDFFRVSRSQAAAAFEACHARGWRRVALAGASDLAEIVSLAAQESGVEIVALLDGDAQGPERIGIPVVGRLDELDGVDAVMVTDITAPQVTYERLLRRFADERVLTLPLLRVSRSKTDGRGSDAE